MQMEKNPQYWRHYHLCHSMLLCLRKTVLLNLKKAWRECPYETQGISNRKRTKRAAMSSLATGRTSLQKLATCV